jgi:hypothetical protein
MGEIERCQWFGNVALVPIYGAVEKKHYGDDHHYSDVGYEVLAKDITIQISYNGWIK